MGYRIRILGKNVTSPPLKNLQQVALPALLEVDPGTEGNWEALVLKHSSGTAIAFIEKNLVIEGELGKAELDEFAEDVAHYGPKSAANWLKSYFADVKVIYSFQLLFGTDVDNGFALMHLVYSAVWRHAGGILQADLEGFSNEDGCTILWQFDDQIRGPWNMGVLGKNGEWINFEMDLGNLEMREAFLRGEIPSGAKVLRPGQEKGQCMQ